MDCLRGLFDHPVVLVHDSSLGGALARACPLAISSAVAGVDRHVDRCWRRDLAVAKPRVLFEWMELDSSGTLVCNRIVDLQRIRSTLQLDTTQRLARSPPGPSRATAGDDRHSRPGQASRVSGASLRDAGVECGDGAGCVLGVDWFRDCYRSGDDSNGGCGTGEEIWEGVCAISRARARTGSETGQEVKVRCSEINEGFDIGEEYDPVIAIPPLDDIHRLKQVVP
jgi:hypothetical protein